MFPKATYLLVTLTLIVATLACSLGQTANDPDTARQALLAQIPAPYSNAAQADKTFVGPVADSQTYIAIVIQKEVVVVYICDGGQVSEWFGGTITGDTLDITSSAGTHLSASLTADSVTGTLTLTGGQPLAFSAQPAITGETGLFRQKDQANLTGWIVTKVGARGLTETANGAQNGLNISIDPSQTQQTLLRIRSDQNEYTIAKDGIGFNLHNFSILELPVNPGQNDFDFFCNDTKFFAGGIVVPEGHILTVDLVADGCQALAAPAEPAPAPQPLPEKLREILPPVIPTAPAPTPTIQIP